MSAFWPTSLPQKPLVNGDEELVIRPKSSFQPDAGPPIQRRKGTVKLSRLAINMRMTEAQTAQFEAFVDDDLGGGALPFLFNHPRTGQQVLAWFDRDDAYRIARFSIGHRLVAFTLLIQT